MSTILELLGLACLVAAAALISVSFGLVILGLSLLVIGWSLGNSEKGSDS